MKNNKSINALSLTIAALLVGCGGSNGSSSSNPEPEKEKLRFNIAETQIKITNLNHAHLRADNFDHLVNMDMELNEDDYTSEGMYPVVDASDYKALDIRKFGEYSVVEVFNSHPAVTNNYEYFVVHNGKHFQLTTSMTQLDIDDVASTLLFPNTQRNKTNYLIHMYYHQSKGNFVLERLDEAFDVVGDLIWWGDDYDLNQSVFLSDGYIAGVYVENAVTNMNFRHWSYSGQLIKFLDGVASGSSLITASNNGDWAIFHNYSGHPTNNLTAVNLDSNTAQTYSIADGFTHAAQHDMKNSNFVAIGNSIIDLNSNFSIESGEVGPLCDYSQNHSMTNQSLFNVGDSWICTINIDPNDHSNNGDPIDGLEIVKIQDDYIVRNTEMAQIQMISFARKGRDTLSIHFDDGQVGTFDPKTMIYKTSSDSQISDVIK